MTELFTIKPLEWEWTGRYWLASTHAFNYVVKGHLTIYNKLQDEFSQKSCVSPEEGKRLANEHWETWIQQGLILATER